VFNVAELMALKYFQFKIAANLKRFTTQHLKTLEKGLSKIKFFRLLGKIIRQICKLLQSFPRRRDKIPFTRS
jgi:hypothetical protein